VSLKSFVIEKKGAIASVVVALCVGIGAGFGIGLLTEPAPTSCEDWQVKYIDVVGNLRNDSFRPPTPGPNQDIAELNEERPTDCPIPATSHAADPSPPNPVSTASLPASTGSGNGLSLPPVVPLVAYTKDPRFTITGYRAELTEYDGTQYYQMKLDLRWVGGGNPDDLDCLVGFLKADGVPLLNMDESILWRFQETDYLDDYTIAIPLSRLMLYLEADGPPSAVSLSCDTSPL
jgi:hypothetical protein